MADNIHELHQVDEELLTTEVSDEVLEESATITNADYKFAACTGMRVCPV